MYQRSTNKIVGHRLFGRSYLGGIIDNISQALKGVSNINYIEEFDPSLTEEQKKGLKRFLVYRSDPSNSDDHPKLMSYWINIEKCGPMYLDALIKIKDNHDSTLAFRRYLNNNNGYQVM